MASILTTIFRSIAHLLNILLPFTNRTTPLLQDIVHTIALCGALYFAPSISEWYQQRQSEPNPHSEYGQPQDTVAGDDDAAIPHDIGIVVEPSDTEDIIDDSSQEEDDNNTGGPPPPQAPTPPQVHEGHRPPPPPQQHPDPLLQPNPMIDPNPDRPRATPQNRPIGTKKAKSLARRDQRRAYHEFLQNEREARRAAEAAGAAEREAQLLAEKQRRAEVEQEILEQKRAERERKKEEERLEQEEEMRRRERLVRAVRERLEKAGSVDLHDLAWSEGKDVLWAEKLIKASGILDKKVDGGFTMITKDGWVVRIDEELMREAYLEAIKIGNKTGGSIGLDKMAEILERTVKRRADG